MEIREVKLKARLGIQSEKKKISQVTEKLLYNLECEKAGVTLPYSWTELHEEAESARNEMLVIADNIPDDMAKFVRDVFPTLHGDSRLIKAGTRINYKGKILRASVDLWDRAENTPDNAPYLWEDINKKDDYREIPETITVGLAFAKDECGWWKGELYKSLIDNNVWTPEAYPSAWEKVGESNG